MDAETGHAVPERAGGLHDPQAAASTQDANAPYAGLHLIVDIRDGHGLDCAQTVERALRRAVKAGGATLLHIHTHKFSPQGISGVAVLAESHISVHTWPEIGYGAFDIFMCGDTDPWAAVDVLRREFQAGSVEVKELKRGLGCTV